MTRWFWTTAELRAAGRSKASVAAAVASAELQPVRRGHYATADAPRELIRAARVGGVATATTAGRVLGLWTPDDDRLHVALPSNAGRLHDPDDAERPFEDRGNVVLHWTARLGDPRSVPTRTAPVLLALEHAMRVLRPELGFAMVDSALSLRHLRVGDLAALAAALPGHLAGVVLAADGRCESGIESITCHLLRLAGLQVEAQVVIPGVGRVDLLVQGRLIIELDGRRWHDDPVAFARDRRRDAAAAAVGYRTLRFDYAQVLFGWRSVEAAVFAALA